jgi:hypothetical protein
VKLPYRLGDIFALPLGDGSFVEARIAVTGHRWVEIAAGGMRLRVWDDALVLKRWKAFDAGVMPRIGPEQSEGPNAADAAKLNPGHAERIVATAMGIGNLELPPLHVHWTRGAATYRPVPPAIRTAAQLAAVPSDVTALKICGPCFEIGPDDLQRFKELAQLELLGFWHWNLSDAMPLTERRQLVRAEIDIGGRRKNVELYRRARWAYPWPFELFAASGERNARSAR